MKNAEYSRRRTVFRIMGGIFAALLIFGLGWFSGHLRATRALPRMILAHSGAETMGRFLGDNERRLIANAYHDPETVLAKMDDISWAVPNVPAPFVGSVPAPGRHHNAEINPLQMRSDRMPALPKPAGTRRIFLIGGSTAFGAGAPSQDRTIGAFLEEKLNALLAMNGDTERVEVFTFANPAWTTTHERILSENRLHEWQPDLVIALSGTNDIHWGLLGRDVLWFRTYAEDFHFRLLDAMHRFAGFSSLADVVEVAREPAPPHLVGRRLERNVRLTLHALALEGVPYVFALQPNLAVGGKKLTPEERLHLAERDSTYFQTCYAEIRQRLAGIQDDLFTAIDLSTVFDDADADRRLFIDSYHFGDLGNEIVATALARAINGMIPLRDTRSKSVQTVVERPAAARQHQVR